MANEACAKCCKKMASVKRWFQCTKCGAWFCPSCMDRFCLFCRGPVEEKPH
ncbi:MAG: hypothetical protein HY922_08350 [Elusimicrobia bacterium]|nr:hypothetical protein [Elusimicrobiota bacterium]